jgi:hypothetical protein
MVESPMSHMVILLSGAVKAVSSESTSTDAARLISIILF